MTDTRAMTDTTEIASPDDSPRKRTYKVTERAGQVARASAEAFTEVSAGAVRIASDLATGLAQSMADNVNATVSDTADLAQRGVDRFFSVLDSARNIEDDELAGSTRTTHRRRAKH